MNTSGWWFGTMEFYDFPFSWEYIIIPTDEQKNYSEGLVETTNQPFVLLLSPFEDQLPGLYTHIHPGDCLGPHRLGLCVGLAWLSQYAAGGGWVNWVNVGELGGSPAVGG